MSYEVELELEVRPSDAPSHRALAQELVLERDLPRLAPGASLVVRYDPRRPERAAIDPGALSMRR